METVKNLRVNNAKSNDYGNTQNIAAKGSDEYKKTDTYN